MMISTKGRYALRVMIDLAQQDMDDYISLRDIATRQGISMKYLELIVANLNRGGMLMSQRGKAGGYRLARKPSEYTVYSILTLMEGSLAPVTCVNKESAVCDRAAQCLTLPMWKKLDEIMDEYLESITIDDLINGRV